MPSRDPAAQGRQGFTLVELIVAVIVLAIGVLGLASTAAVVTRQMGGSQMQNIAAAVAQQRFERLRALPCASLANGNATTRRITETWTVTGGASDPVRTVSVAVSYKATPAAATARTHTYTSMRKC